jgi:hypothetical protein
LGGSYTSNSLYKGEKKAMTSTVDNIGIIIGVVSAITAVVSLAFAWKAVRIAEKSNAGGAFTEIHKIYQDDRTFKAIQKVWDLYHQHQDKADGTVITEEQAREFVSGQDRQSAEWKAVHDMSLFWKYVSILVRKGYLDEEIAFEAFTSPRMLGFLSPIERAFVEHSGGKVDEKSSPLIWLYRHWKSYSEKR